MAITQASSIPVIDLAPARTGSDEQARKVAQELYEAFKNVGFAYVKNHAVPEDVVSEAFRWVCLSRRPHITPIDYKRRIHLISSRAAHSSAFRRKTKIKPPTPPKAGTTAATPASGAKKSRR